MTAPLTRLTSFASVAQLAAERGVDAETIADARRTWQHIDYTGPAADVSDDLYFIAGLLRLDEIETTDFETIMMRRLK